MSSFNMHAPVQDTDLDFFNQWNGCIVAYATVLYDTTMLQQ